MNDVVDCLRPLCLSGLTLRNADDDNTDAVDLDELLHERDVGVVTDVQGDQDRGRLCNLGAHLFIGYPRLPRPYRRSELVDGDGINTPCAEVFREIHRDVFVENYAYCDIGHNVPSLGCC